VTGDWGLQLSRETAASWRFPAAPDRWAGHSSECFGFVKDWAEKKIRRHMLRARKQPGFGWTRWSRDWLYDTLGLFNGYRAVRLTPKVAPAG